MTNHPGIFVGSWVGHSRELVVNANGSAQLTYRAYILCSQNPTPPCDQLVGNAIIAGGRVTLRVTQVVTANHMSTATAIVLMSSDPVFGRGSTQTFVLNGDVITWAKNFANRAWTARSFCDPKAQQSGTCGA